MGKFVLRPRGSFGKGPVPAPRDKDRVVSEPTPTCRLQGDGAPHLADEHCTTTTLPEAGDRAEVGMPIAVS